MNNVYHDSIAGVLRATELQRGFTYLWFGKPFGEMSTSIKRLLDGTAARNHLLSTLEANLYALFYCVGQATCSAELVKRRPVIPLGPELQRAN